MLYPAELRARSVMAIPARRRGRQGRGGAVAAAMALLASLLAPAATLAAERSVTVRAVEAGDRLALADGTILRLSGLVLPESGRAAMRIEAQAQAKVTGLVDGRPVTITPVATDRHGALMAEARNAEGVSLEAALVAAGLAYAWPTLANPASMPLLALEEKARRADRGLWREPALTEQQAGRVRSMPPRFAVVRGRVLQVSPRRYWVYLNFGADWRRDFTARITLDDAAAMRRRGHDPAALEGHEVRLRGWLFPLAGPMMEITEETQIEVVE